MECETKYHELAVGRQVAYFDLGNPQGRPFFYFHGSPGSRLEATHICKAWIKNGYRIIAPDRPGIGKSEFLDFSRDILEIADILGWRKFSVMGASGGSPIVMACAYSFPQRLEVGIDIAGWAPIGTTSLSTHLSPIDRSFGYLAQFLPGIFNIPYALLGLAAKHLSSHAFFKLLESSLCEADKRFLENPIEAIFFRNVVKESFAQGIRGPARDALLMFTDWGFNLEDISIPILLFCGTADKFSPIELARYKVNTIPNTSLHTFHGEGHFSILSHMDEIFEIFSKSCKVKGDYETTIQC
jgi:pimeloyl-ACP methyl ester carboxylesterase